jgi:hypothetical protein
VLAALVAALACVNGAAADRTRLNHNDQAAASRDVLHLSDLPPTVKWKPTAFSSNEGATPASCSNLDSSSSQIVDTGRAASQFTTPGILVMNQVGLVARSSMVGLIWEHIFAQPITRCLGDAFNQGGSGHINVLTTAPLSLPRLARYESAYRIVFRLDVQGKSVRGACDLVMLGGSRTLSMLMVVAILGSARNQATGELGLALIDLRLSQIIAGRAFPAANSSRLSA